MSLVGAKVLRKEDPRLLSGTGQFVDDLSPTGCTFASFVMSSEAHARITAIDVRDALAIEGVLAVYTAADFADFPDLPGGLPDLERPLLARNIVRFVGEPVAIVVADDRYIAADAAQAVIIDYEPLPRTGGKSNFGLRGSLALAFTGILAFSIAPLRALTVTGFLLSMLALGYGVWVMGEYFISGIAVPGYATIVVGMMFFSGIQLLSIGILAEYVGRIYEEVKQRPNYLVSQRLGQGLPLQVAQQPAGLPETPQIHQTHQA